MKGNDQVEEVSILCCSEVAKIPERDGVYEKTCPVHGTRYRVTRETTGRSPTGVGGHGGNLRYERWIG